MPVVGQLAIAGWPSLLQAGCVAQEASARPLIREERSTPQNVTPNFLGPSAPGLKAGWPGLIHLSSEVWHYFGMDQSGQDS